MSSAASDIATARAAASSATRVDDPVARVHATLAQLCRAEVPLPQALASLQDELGRGRLRDALAAIAADVEAGTPFPLAYAAHAKAFPAPYAALVAAGVAGGDLPGALDEIALHAARRARVVEATRRTLMRPAATGVVVLLVGTGIAVFAGPRLSALAASGCASGVFGGSANGLREDVAWAALGVLTALLVVTAALVLRRRPLDGAAAAPRWALRLPVVGRIRSYGALATHFATLAALVRREVPLPEALDLAVATQAGGPLAAEASAMASAAHGGASVSDAVRAGRCVPPSLLSLLDAAATTGRPAEGLDDLAELYAARYERSLRATTAVLGPAAELLVGGVVLLIAWVYVLPLLQTPLSALASRG